MKKLLVGSALALALTLASQQSASAWSEFKFSVGVNICYRGGGNYHAWNISHVRYSAPYPGCYDGGFAPGFLVRSTFSGFPGHAYADAAPAWQAPAPNAAPTAPAAAAQQAYSPYYNTGYQPVGYFPGYSQTPSYWYGGR